MLLNVQFSYMGAPFADNLLTLVLVIPYYCYDACVQIYPLLITGCLCFSPCQCSEAGSVGIACHQAGGQCSCKDNVEGDKCDTCKADTFNLNPLNPHGCQRCFCYGHGSQCTAATGFTSYMLVSEE